MALVDVQRPLAARQLRRPACHRCARWPTPGVDLDAFTRGKRGSEVIELALKLSDSRELHAERTLNVFEFLGDAAQNLGELDNVSRVRTGHAWWASRANGTPNTTRTTTAVGPASRFSFLRSFRWSPGHFRRHQSQ